MTREEAIKILKEERWYMSRYSEEYKEAYDMAIEALSADAILTKIQIDDIDKAKTSSQLLDDLAVDMVKAMGKRIVEVVRCKDCRHYGSDGGALMVCDVSDMVVDNTDYCSYGERREP